jgi:hypothetical protein
MFPPRTAIIAAGMLRDQARIRGSTTAYKMNLSGSGQGTPAPGSRVSVLVPGVAARSPGVDIRPVCGRAAGGLKHYCGPHHQEEHDDERSENNVEQDRPAHAVTLLALASAVTVARPGVCKQGPAIHRSGCGFADRSCPVTVSQSTGWRVAATQPA